MDKRFQRVMQVSAVAVLLCGGARPALAIPAFARKYQTSCTTCHTAWPKLNPFGEAFRRNGFRFPGDDSDAIKQQMIKLGADAYKQIFPRAVWPASLTDSLPVAIGFIGTATGAPIAGSSATAANPGIEHNPDGSPKLDANGNPIHAPYFSLAGLTTEAHLWGGGSFNDSLSYFGEVTFTAGSVNIERGYLIFDDILGDQVAPHVFNLLVGKNFATMTSFDNHSSYVVDGYIPEINVAPMFRGTGSFTPGITELDTLELNGTVAGRISYSLGWNAGTNDIIGAGPFTMPSSDLYGHVGFKLGGMRLDGEGLGQVSSKAWEETALTVDAFAYHSESYYTNDQGAPLLDTGFTFGGAARAQWRSLELDVGAMNQSHNHPDSTGTAVNATTAWGEVSYVVFPWLIPALRVEWTRLSDDLQIPAGTSLARVVPGVNFLVRPNIRVLLYADVERGGNAPPGGWSGAGGILALPSGTAGTEFETVSASLLYAY